MRIGFIGDIHGSVYHALAAIVTWQRIAGAPFDFIVQVGDMGAFPDPTRVDPTTAVHLALDDSEGDFARLLTATGDTARDLRLIRSELLSPVHFVRGNHEDFGWLASLPVEHDARTAAVDPCGLLRYVPDGTVLERGGVRIAFLGGIEEQKGAAHFGEAAYGRLMSLAPGSIDVLVTHEGPYGSSVGYHGDTHGSQMISALIAQLRPPFHVAGHAHQLSGPAVYGSTLYLGLDGLLPSPRWQPEARGLQPGCLGLLDTERRELTPIADDWLDNFPTPFDFPAWASANLAHPPASPPASHVS